jgi:hypothetical protein
MLKIDPTSLSFGELRDLLSALEIAEREAGRFSPAIRETIIDPFLTAAKQRGIDVAEFPRLTDRQPVADARQVPSGTPSREATKQAEKGAHPFSARSRRGGGPTQNAR